MKKLITGIFTFLPIVIMIFSMYKAISLFPSMMSNMNAFEDEKFMELWVTMFGIQIVMALNTMGLLIYYVINVIKNKRVSNEMRVIWIVLFFLGGMIAMPIYWGMYILKENLESDKAAL